MCFKLDFIVHVGQCRLYRQIKGGLVLLRKSAVLIKFGQDICVLVLLRPNSSEIDILGFVPALGREELSDEEYATKKNAMQTVVNVFKNVLDVFDTLLSSGSGFYVQPVVETTCDKCWDKDGPWSTHSKEAWELHAPTSTNTTGIGAHGDWKLQAWTTTQASESVHCNECTNVPHRNDLRVLQKLKEEQLGMGKSMEAFQIGANDLQIFNDPSDPNFKLLGKGNFGDVYLGKMRTTGEEKAVKVQRKSHFSESELRRLFEEELNMYKLLKLSCHR